VLPEDEIGRTEAERKLAITTEAPQRDHLTSIFEGLLVVRALSRVTRPPACGKFNA
jgi:hypothetical protein